MRSQRVAADCSCRSIQPPAAPFRGGREPRRSGRCAQDLPALRLVRRRERNSFPRCPTSIILHREIDEKHRHIAADHRKMEEQANAFAGAFLLPAQSFARDIYAVTLEALRSLKPKWKVAIGAMLKRAEAPGFISEHQVQKTWIAYSRRGWRLREPVDHELEPEQPYLLRRAFEALVQSGANVRAEVVASGLCSPRDIEILCGLPGGFLSEEGPRGTETGGCSSTLPGGLLRQSATQSIGGSTRGCGWHFASWGARRYQRGRSGGFGRRHRRRRTRRRTRAWIDLPTAGRHCGPRSRRRRRAADPREPRGGADHRAGGTGGGRRLCCRRLSLAGRGPGRDCDQGDARNE